MAINTKQEGDCGYVVFGGRQRIEVYANSRLAARQRAAQHLKIKPAKEYTLEVVLAEKADGTVYEHTATS